MFMLHVHVHPLYLKLLFSCLCQAAQPTADYKALVDSLEHRQQTADLFFMAKVEPFCVVAYQKS